MLNFGTPISFLFSDSLSEQSTLAFLEALSSKAPVSLADFTPFSDPRRSFPGTPLGVFSEVVVVVVVVVLAVRTLQAPLSWQNLV